MELTYTNSFVDLSDSNELYDVNGGSLLSVCIGCACIVGGCFLIGMAAGAAYEYFMGK